MVTRKKKKPASPARKSFDKMTPIDPRDRLTDEEISLMMSGLVARALDMYNDVYRASAVVELARRAKAAR